MCASLVLKYIVFTMMRQEAEREKDACIRRASNGMLESSGRMPRTRRSRGGHCLMRAHIRWLLFQIKRGWLYARGLLHFGLGPTHRGGKAVHLALDAFEDYHDRLPTQEEQVRLVRKLSWF